MSYAIVKLDTGDIVARYSVIPGSFEVIVDGNNKRIISPVNVGDEGLGYRFVQLDEVGFARPGTYYTQGDDEAVLNGDVLTVTRSWIPWTQQEIDDYEASRRDDIADQLNVSDDLITAVVLVILDEFNRHKDLEKAIFDATAGAGSLAAFKTAMAAVTQVPTRSAADIKAAIRAKLG